MELIAEQDWEPRAMKRGLIKAIVLGAAPADHVHGKARVLALSSRLSFDGKAPYPKDLMLSVYTCGWHGFEVWDWRKA